MMKLQFTERVGSASLTAQVDDKDRVFNRSEEPFEVTDAEGKALIETGYFEECATVRFRLREANNVPQVDVFQGNFNRKFVRAEQPFEVTQSAWEQHVEPTGLFEREPEQAAAESQQQLTAREKQRQQQQAQENPADDGNDAGSQN